MDHKILHRDASSHDRFLPFEHPEAEGKCAIVILTSLIFLPKIFKLRYLVFFRGGIP